MSWLIGMFTFIYFIAPAGGLQVSPLLSDWLKPAKTLLLLNFLSSITLLMLTSSDMTESWKSSELLRAIGATSVGHIFCFKLAILGILLIAANMPGLHPKKFLLIFCFTLILPLFSSLSGHAGAEPGQFQLRILIDWIHSVAVGVWTGGLWALYIWLGKFVCVSGLTQKSVYRVVSTFSHFALVSTAMIFVTGIAMAYYARIPVFHPWSSPYGALVLFKIGLFSAALCAAAINQFIHLKNALATDQTIFANGIRREVRIELAFILAIFAAAGFLVRTSLPVP